MVVRLTRCATEADGSKQLLRVLYHHDSRDKILTTPAEVIGLADMKASGESQLPIQSRIPLELARGKGCQAHLHCSANLAHK